MKASPARARVCLGRDGRRDAFAAGAARTGFWPTTAAGACSQRPMQGAAMTRTPGPRSSGRRASRSCAPAISHDRLSQTRTVSAARRGLAFLDDVEVVIEARDLVDLGLRQAHLLRERGEVAPTTGGRSDPGSCAGARSAGRARRGSSPSSVWHLAPAPAGSTRRPFGASRLRWRVDASRRDRDDGAGHALRAAPRHAPTGTSRRAPRPGSRSNRHRPGCRARRGTAPLPRPRRRRPATRRPA